ncbi:peptidase G2 autoproteolytic cleavage domain-containing protein [Rhizobium leguminosarum]|uniref:peptidase G2 autoproteolytic cleavage domain-containing protein n=1 Tax=Rhizobium leguminosarum TaxID=384 RepID=UPI003F9E90D9
MMVPNLTSTGTGSGTPGPRGFSAYEIAQQEGFEGTQVEWLASLEGDSAYQIAVDEGFVGDKAAWIESMKGAPGAAGTGLTNRGAFALGSVYKPSDYVFATGSTTPTSMFISQADEDFTAAAEPKDDSDHWVEFSAPAGEDGKSISLRKTATAIQWMEVPDGAWMDLVLLADLKGPPGDAVAYDDTAIKQRVSNVETAVAGKAASADLGTQTTRIDGIIGADGQTGRLETVETSLASAVKYDANKNITANYLFAGGLSDDGNGNYVPDSGGISIGGLKGVRYRQEGFIADADEGSIAAYPNVVNRANRLALCPSGEPADIVGEDTASFALQHKNGSYEQRFCLISKKAGEYRLASVATGVGLHFPITVAPGPIRVARFETNGTTTFTSENLGGQSATNTVVSIKNPAVAQFIRLFGRSNGLFGIEYVSAGGNQDYRFNQAGLSIGGSDAAARFSALVTDQGVGSFYTSSTHATYSGFAYQADVARVASSGFAFFVARSATATSPDIEFSLRGDGNGFADGAWNANGADYAELFEWEDGNGSGEDRVGRSVVLVGDKIRLAAAGEDPVGVISASPSVLGNAGWNSWQGKYLTDDFGRVQKDADGAPILNPAFDPEVTYKPREDRPEWSPVGLTGRLRLYKGQPTGSRWIKLTDVSANAEEWLVR